MKLINIFIVFMFFSIIGCIDENFDDTFNNTAIKSEVSIPLGYANYILKTTDFDGPSSTVPGIYGITYFNDSAYTQNNLYYERTEQFKFKISNYKEVFEKNIESFMFRVNIYNSYPTDCETQIYLIDEAGMLLDSVFQEGPILIKGGRTDDSGRSLGESFQIIDVPFDQNLDIIKQTYIFDVRSKIYTIKKGLNTIRFYDTSKIRIIAGARVKFHVYANDL